MHFSLKPRMDLLIVPQIRYAHPLQLQNPACPAVRPCMQHPHSCAGVRCLPLAHPPWLPLCAGQCSCNFETESNCHTQNESNPRCKLLMHPVRCNQKSGGGCTSSDGMPMTHRLISHSSLCSIALSAATASESCQRTFSSSGKLPASTPAAPSCSLFLAAGLASCARLAARPAPLRDCQSA